MLECFNEFVESMSRCLDYSLGFLHAMIFSPTLLALSV